MISAAQTFREISRKLEVIETNLAVVEPYEKAPLLLSRWRGFFVTDQDAFHDEVQAIRYYLLMMSLNHSVSWIEREDNTLPEPYCNMGSVENSRRLTKIVRRVWPGERIELKSIFTPTESECHTFMDRLIVASTYYRHRCDKLHKAIVLIQRRFKERVYAPGGSLAQKAHDQWNRHLNHVSSIH
jgi:hypothetical protein